VIITPLRFDGDKVVLVDFRSLALEMRIFLIAFVVFLKHFIFGLLVVILSNSFSQTTLTTPNVESKLFLDNSNNQLLIVWLSGSEGSNVSTSNHWKKNKRPI